MAANEYDAIVRDQAPVANEYDAVILDLQSRHKSQLRASIHEAVQSSPDQFARARDLSQRTGIPAPVVERNLDDVERRSKVNEYDEMLQANPVLAEYMRSPEFAKLAHDDLDNAGMLERAAKTLVSGFGPRASQGVYGVAQFVAEGVATDIDRFLVRPGIFPANPAAEAARFFERKRLQNKAYADYLTRDNAQAGVIERGVYSGIESIGQNTPLLLGAFLTRRPDLALTGMSGIVAGQEYGEARDEGIAPGQATLYALSQAAVEYATEKIPVGRLFGDLEKETGFFKTLLGQLATEIPGEQIATVVQDLNQWAVLNPEKPFSDYLAERPTAAAETLVATLVASVGQSSAVQGADAAARRIAGEQRRADMANMSAEQLAALAQAAANSKLRTRAVDSFEQFVAQASAEGEVQDVYVEAEVLAQTLEQAGVEPQDVAPSVAEQLDEARAVNGDVRIPVGEFAARIAGQDYADALLPHLRADPEAMSAAEAETFNQGAAEEFQREAERVLAQQEESETIRTSAENVGATILDQLTQANRFTADVNNAYASLMRDFYTVVATRMGVTPEEAYQRFPLRVTAESVTGGLEQSAFHGSPHLFDKFSLANIGTGEGAQAFGWGLYFAESQGTAEHYRNTLRESNAWLINGQRFHGMTTRADASAHNVAANALSRFNGDRELAIEFLNDFGREGEAREIIRNAKSVEPADDGALYEVEIPDEVTERMLDWDAPLAEQPEVARVVNEALGLREETVNYWKAELSKDLAENGPGGYSDDRLMRVVDEVVQFGEYGPEFGSSAYDELREAAPERADEFIDVVERQGAGGIDPNVDTGAQVYRLLSNALGSEQRASERLLAAGIPGIKYFDAASRDEGDGTRNLVLFDDSLVTIKSINGRPVDDNVLRQDALANATETPEFKAWFGDSKVVDENGEPLVVYHGTAAEFDTFDASKVRDVGFHFGDKEAADYVAERERQAGGRPRVLPVYLSVKNPLRIADTNFSPFEFPRALAGQAERGVIDGLDSGELLELADSFDALRGSPDAARQAAELVIEYLESRGFDGLVYSNRKEGRGTSWVAFRSEQIKSAVGNRGTFDPASPNILDQSGPNRDLLGEPGVTGLTELAQGATSAPRGQIALDGEGGATIALLRNADLSTFLHESGHFFLEVYADLAARPDTPPEIADDFNAVLKWFGVPDAATWQGMTLEQRRPHHEKFARGFEAYLFEDKAPTAELEGLFARFRAWLLNVYQSLNSLNVELTDEVRGVFNRMLASEQAIEATQAARNFAPLFESAEDAGMTAREFEAYQEGNRAAKEAASEQLQKRSLRDMRWLSNAKSRVLKELQKDAMQKRNGVREEVAAEVAAEPVYRARRFLRDGKVERGDETITVKEHKLSLAALEEMYPDGEIDYEQLTRGKRGVTKRGGLHPDLVAEMLGFSSGDHLVRALAEAPPINDVIEVRTEQVMLERFGDLTDALALERAAEEAIHNEARARFVATEIRALNRLLNVRARTPRGGSVNVTMKAAREFAAATIARLRIRDVRPAQFARAETRAAKAADREMKAGNTLAAATEKRNQLVATLATRYAYDAVNEIEKGLRYLNKFQKDGVRKKLDADYVEQIDALLERFDLRRRQLSARDLAKRQSLVEWVEAQRELGFEPVIDDAVLQEAYRKPYREMSVEEFRGLVDAVRNVEHLGRLKQKLLTAAKDRAFADAVEDAEQSIRDNARKTIPEELESNAFGARLQDGVKEFFAMHRKLASIVRQMDGFKDGGALWELFIRPLNAAADREAVMREEATKALTEIFKPVLKGRSMRHKTHIPAIGKSLSREGRLSIALNWGNKVNRARVMEGDNWTEQQVEAILDTLSKEEWDFVQAVWDHIDSYWQTVSDKERRVTGLRPEKVEADPVRTRFGEYRGGYYPIAYDPQRSSRAEADSVAETVKNSLRGLYTRATTRRGHTKARVDSVKNRPLRKDLGVIFKHVSEVTHDLAYHEYLIDANRLLRAPAIDRAIRDHYGPTFLREMRRALEDTAAGDIPAQDAWEQSLHHIRVGATIAGLGWNLFTGMLQPIGLTQSVVRIGPKYVWRGVSRWFGNASRMESSIAWIHERSDFMRLRHKTMQREINEVQNQIRGRERMTKVTSSFFYLIQKLQQVADVPTWLGAYEKAMEQETDEARAIALADQAVVDAQGGGQVKDLARVQRGGPMRKLWTNFYSFFNTTYNLTAESVHRTDFRKPADIGRLAVDYLLLYTLPASLAYLMREALRGGGDEDELAEELIRENLGFMLSTMLGVRELGAVAQGFRYSGPAGLRGLDELSRLWQQVEQGEVDAASLKALNAVGGILFHYPAGQVQRSVEGAVALIEGDTQNPMALVVGPPRD